MSVHYKKSAFRILFLVAAPKLVNQAVELMKEGELPLQYLFHGQGTATSEIMDMLGLDAPDKKILMCVMPKVFADKMIKKLKKQLYLGMPNSGIAFTVAMSGGSAHMIQIFENLHYENNQEASRKDEVLMADSEYSLIMAIVNQGYSEEVMDAARPVGASGGTVFHSRRIGQEKTMKFWGIRVQQERETVLILVRKEDKTSVMQAIGQKCGMHSEAHGIVMSLPVDEVAGLNLTD